MKIISTELPQRHYGLVRAASQVMDFNIWTPQTYPVYDVLDEVKPDIIFIDLKQVNRLIIAALNEYPHVKVVLFGQGVPRDMNPSILVASPTTSPMIRKNIESEDHATLYLRNSANIVDIFNGQYNPDYECDIAYICNVIKPDTYEDQIVKLANLAERYKIKVVGSARIAIPQFLGSITYVATADLYRSASFSLDYYGDQQLDIAANGGFAMPANLTLDEMYSILDDKRDGKKTSKAINALQRSILYSDTCYHRLIEILDTLQLSDISLKAKQKLGDKISCVLE